MTGQVELHTQRTVLRPMQLGDVEDALLYRDDQEFSRYLPHIPQPFKRQDAEAFVKLNMALHWDVSPTFAVVLGGRVIGTVNLEVNIETRSAMLGYAIGRHWWGHGVATEAARAAMAWAIETFGLSRIWASTDLRNVKSTRVLKKLGMKFESLLNAHHVGRNGERVDEVVYGLNLSDSTLTSSLSSPPSSPASR